MVCATAIVNVTTMLSPITVDLKLGDQPVKKEAEKGKGPEGERKKDAETKK